MTVCSILAIVSSVYVFSFSAPYYKQIEMTMCQISGALDGSGRKYKQCIAALEPKQEEPEVRLKGGITEQFIYSVKITSLKAISPEFNLKSVKADDGELKVVYELHEEQANVSAMNASIKQLYEANRRKLCASREYRSFFEKGASIKYIFKNKDSDILKRAEVSLGHCFKYRP